MAPPPDTVVRTAGSLVAAEVGHGLVHARATDVTGQVPYPRCCDVSFSFAGACTPVRQGATALLSPESAPACVLLVRLLIDVSVLIQEPVPLGILPIRVDPPREPDGEERD